MAITEDNFLTNEEIELLRDTEVMRFIKFDSEESEQLEPVYNITIENKGFIIYIGYRRVSSTSYQINAKTTARCTFMTTGMRTGVVSMSSNAYTDGTPTTFFGVMRNSDGDVNYNFPITPELSVKEYAHTSFSVTVDVGGGNFVYTFDVRATPVDNDEVLLSAKLIGGKEYSEH